MTIRELIDIEYAEACGQSNSDQFAMDPNLAFMYAMERVARATATVAHAAGFYAGARFSDADDIDPPLTPRESLHTMLDEMFGGAKSWGIEPDLY